MGVCQCVHVGGFANVAWTWYDAYALCWEKTTYYASRQIILISIHMFVEKHPQLQLYVFSWMCIPVLTMIIL